MSDFVSEAHDEFNQTGYIQTKAPDGDAVVGYIFVFIFFPKQQQKHHNTIIQWFPTTLISLIMALQGFADNKPCAQPAYPPKKPD